MTVNKPAPELVARYRVAERRLRAAYRQLKPRWTFNGRVLGDAMVARDALAMVRFERRVRRHPSEMVLNLWGAQIDTLCRRAGARGGSCHAHL